MLDTGKYYKGYYVIADKKLIYATHQLDDRTGALLPFTDKAKLFYLHMLEQYISYSNAGKPYYETQESLGKMFGVSDQQAYRVVNQLKDLNLIYVVKEGYRRYHTTVRTLDQLPLALKWVNTKLDNKPPLECKKLKISSEEYLVKETNKKRWEQVEREIRAEKASPYTDHRRENTHRITASIEEYKEFKEWKAAKES